MLIPARITIMEKALNAPSPQTPLIGIVDDDADVRKSLDSFLRSIGLQTASFATAEELLACDRIDGIDSIVSDLHMPGMSGLDLQAELIRKCWHGELVIMTGYPTIAERNFAIARGAKAFLAKPISPDQLLETIASA